MRNDEITDRSVEDAGRTGLVRDAQGLQPAQRLLGQVGVVEDHEIGGLRYRPAVEVDPVVHHAHCASLVIVVQLGAAVVLRSEPDDLQPQLRGLVLNPLRQLTGAGQVRNRPSLIEGIVGDQQRHERLPLAGRHLDRHVRRRDVASRVSGQHLPLTRPKLPEGSRLKPGKPLVEVRYSRRVRHRSLLRPWCPNSTARRAWSIESFP